MNILYCGDEKTKDGLLISVLSLLKNVKEELNIYIITMRLEYNGKTYYPVSDNTVAFLDKTVKKVNVKNFVKKRDITEIFQDEIPLANMNTRFTPYCMLRLYADKIDDFPDRVLYLDNDVICRRDCSIFYNQDMNGWELAGVLDHYGRFFFRRKVFKMDYINSGVLLLNMKKIKEEKLFEKCRKMCREKKMFMPDQSAINKLSAFKRIHPRKYNEQRKLHRDTVMQHFTTSFRFYPWIHTLTVKPWQVEQVHSKLKLHEYDDILERYESMEAMLQ